MLLFLTVVMSVPYLAGRFKVLPPIFGYLPELLAALVLAYIIFAGTKSRFRYVRAEYWLAFGTIAAVMVCGIFANSVAPGPVFAGIRNYLRAIPLFFLPAVFLFSEKQMGRQLRWLGILCLLQLPAAVYERLHVINSGRTSGDSVVGTVEDSSCLSIILIAATCVLTALAVRGFVPRKRFVVLFLLLLLPTTINETKATLILLPIGLLITVLVASQPQRRLQVGAMAMIMLVTFFSIFIPIYEYLQRNTPYHVPITTFFTDPDAFMRYVGGHAQTTGSVHVGRLDGIRIPLRYMSNDPSLLAFGVGLGNASHSNMGEQFTGRYYLMFEKFELSCITMFLLELGLLGTGMVFLLYWLIFRDSLIVARIDPGPGGALAAAWAGIVAMTVVSMPYKEIYVFPSLSFLFWYLAGYVAARRMILTRGPEYDPVTTELPASQHAAAR